MNINECDNIVALHCRNWFHYLSNNKAARFYFESVDEMTGYNYMYTNMNMLNGQLLQLSVSDEKESNCCSDLWWRKENEK